MYSSDYGCQMSKNIFKMSIYAQKTHLLKYTLYECKNMYYALEYCGLICKDTLYVIILTIILVAHWIRVGHPIR